MLIVETGAGLTNSNSYASLEAADAFAQARGIESWFSIERNLGEAALTGCIATVRWCPLSME